MQKTDVRRCFGDDLAIQLQHEPQNSMSGGVRRPHIQHHLLADIVLAGLAQCGIGSGHAGDRVR